MTTTEAPDNKVEFESMYRRWIAQELRSAHIWADSITTPFAAYQFGRAIGEAGGITIAQFFKDSRTALQMATVRRILIDKAKRYGL